MRTKWCQQIPIQHLQFRCVSACGCSHGLIRAMVFNTEKVKQKRVRRSCVRRYKTRCTLVQWDRKTKQGRGAHFHCTESTVNIGIWGPSLHGTTVLLRIPEVFYAVKLLKIPGFGHFCAESATSLRFVNPGTLGVSYWSARCPETPPQKRDTCPKNDTDMNFSNTFLPPLVP